ncbi:phosphatase PAP2 family protein [Faunimonas sp. B44]|uniref:phosphatase PAP2 family protein n=1 Tax=Faunimonas sp. B44 TaxID=3461493 RepID=UPI004044EAAD
MDREDRIKTAIVASVLALDAAGMAALGLRFDWASAWKVLVAWPVLMALGWFYMAWRKDPPVAHLMRETGHLAAFTAAAAMLSYLATASDRPLIDGALVAFDRLMGFDWLAYVAFVNERDWLGRVSSLLYISTLPQVALAAILLPVLGMSERARELVLAVMIGALIAILVSAILPSAGALAHFRPDPEFYARSAPIVDLAYKGEFFRMRALEIPVLSLDGAKGLIAFPSYHVTLSVLIALAFRGRPFLFWPLLALNTGVILSTPVDGGHHLVDGLAGAAVAVVSLRLAIRIRRAIHRPALAAAPPAGAAEGAQQAAAARAIV